ncbi:MAG: 2-amino-4-hydroxy-6-hydroxymethyldihydropteridine diphosphokinase [Gammaproteobacteria bacterium]|nr:2-amino-4-hydroxy-6-hydroxymethyldihydropteridine diphosphokinase [Gammaproteobacteria bacterium]
MRSQSSTTAERSGSYNSCAYLALGSNLASNHGSPAATVLAAMDEITSWSDHPIRRSSLWSSSPVDCPPGSPPFVNAALAMIPEVSETPRSLLTRMLKLERVFGRRQALEVNAPRCLDLDLICFGDQQLAEDDLIVPHPRAHRRSFVLTPLAEIAPDLRIPGQLLCVAELARMVGGSDPGIEKIEP